MSYDTLLYLTLACIGVAGFSLAFVLFRADKDADEKREDYIEAYSNLKEQGSIILAQFFKDLGTSDWSGAYEVFEKASKICADKEQLAIELKRILEFQLTAYVNDPTKRARLLAELKERGVIAVYNPPTPPAASIQAPEVSQPAPAK